DMAKTEAALRRKTLSSESRVAIAKMVQERVLPLLKMPVTDLDEKGSGNPRFACEWRRSFVMGIFTFVWFFVVPMPGLLVFTAPGGYRISTLLTSLLVGA